MCVHGVGRCVGATGIQQARLEDSDRECQNRRVLYGVPEGGPAPHPCCALLVHSLDGARFGLRLAATQARERIALALAIVIL